MNIKIDLTPELLAVLPAEHCKEILLQLITVEKTPIGKTQLEDTQPISTKPWNKKISDELLEEIHQRVVNGERVKHLAREYGIVYTTLISALDRRKKKTLVEAVEAEVLQPQKAVVYLPYTNPLDLLEPLELHVHKSVFWDDSGINKDEALQMFRKLLDDPNTNLWRISEMYKGIEADQHTLSTEELAEKYGMTTTRIQAIIRNNCYRKNNL